jgi:hypothetical protein
VSRLGFTLTIVGLLGAILVLVSWYLVPALFLERSDGDEDDSTRGLHMTVPRYSRETSTEGLQETVPQDHIVSVKNDLRECYAPEIAAAHCYLVAALVTA